MFYKEKKGVRIIEISQLRYFLEICKVGSMARASQNMNISQQGISISIRRLEDELGADLFFRGSKGLSLTEFGKKVCLEAEVIIEHIDNIQKLSKINAQKKTPLVIAVTFGRFTKLPVSLQQLLLTPPDEYSIKLINDYSTKVEELVLNDEASFGLVYDVSAKELFNVTKLSDEQQVFIVNKNHKFADRTSISISELDGMPMLMPDKLTRPGKTLMELFNKNGANLNAVYECNVPSLALNIVKSNPNLVARILLSDVSEEDARNVTVLRLEDNKFTISFSLISKKDKKLNIHEQLFKRLILDCYREDQS